MWLLMFACLLVYLFISLFIIWKWLYKLLLLLQIQTNSFGSRYFSVLVFFFFFCSVFYFLFEETPYKKKLTKYSKRFVTAATLFKQNSWINEALSVMWLKTSRLSNIWELSFLLLLKMWNYSLPPGLIEIAALWTLLLFTAPFCRTSALRQRSRGFSLLIASLSNLLLINSHLCFLFLFSFPLFLFRLAIETVDIAESILTFNLPSRGTPRS